MCTFRMFSLLTMVVTFVIPNITVIRAFSPHSFVAQKPSFASQTFKHRKVVTKKSRPVTDLFLLNPADISTAGDVNAVSNIVEYASSFGTFVVAKYSLPWGICLSLSLYYAYGLLVKKEKDPCTIDGFCVSGYCDKPPAEDPDVTNSHLLSWNVDVVFTAVALILPKVDEYLNGALSLEPLLPNFVNSPRDADSLFTIFIAIAIVSHGFLHKVLGGLLDKGDTVESLQSEVNETVLEVAFFMFTLLLVALTVVACSNIFYVVGSSVPYLFGVIIGLSLVIYQLTSGAAGEVGAVSAFFMSTQVLVSFIGFFFPNNRADLLMGWTYILPCAVSLVEFQDCQNFLKDKGGHVWYDVTLHTCLLTGLWGLQLNNPGVVVQAILAYFGVGGSSVVAA